MFNKKIEEKVENLKSEVENNKKSLYKLISEVLDENAMLKEKEKSLVEKNNLLEEKIDAILKHLGLEYCEAHERTQVSHVKAHLRVRHNPGKRGRKTVAKNQKRVEF